MGWYVHLHVAFSCYQNEGVAEVARKHAAAYEGAELDDATRYAKWFLDDLGGRTGSNPGPKGGLSLWGMVGNYTRVGDFCEALRPFWDDLLTGEIDGGPSGHARVIVFEEQEQSEAATAYEIARDEDTGGLTITKHALPFAWMQF